jgi:twitching motility protein PilT
MDQLTQYLQELMAVSGYELRLEPNANPYVLSASGPKDLPGRPLQGSQISMMVFPLIPADIKKELPSQQSVQFVYPSDIGVFNFVVMKSPSGFNVTITPVDGAGPAPMPGPFTPAEGISADTVIEESSPIEDVPVSGDAGVLIDTAAWGTEPVGSFGLDVEPITFIDPEGADLPTEAHPPIPQFGDFEVESIEPATEYVPPPDHFTHLPADEIIRNSVVDRRNSERLASNSTMRMRMDALFNAMSQAGASDLHLSVGMPPMMRKDGRMQPMNCGEGVLSEGLLKDLLHSIMPERNKNEFAERHDTDFAYEITGLARFRSNIFMDRKGLGAVFRIIPSKMTTAEQLGLSKAIMGLTELSKGLVVVTGPTGSGKSTTLCAMVNHINQTREDHIITIEDPVEFVHENIKCLVNQREVHTHTMSFKDALRAALREDPDIILVGEMRDLETISIAIETAETGHLVFGTLHTTTAVSTVDRIIDQFPADRQQQVRVMLSESLKGVIAQTLLPKKGGGRVAALEVLIVTPAISNLIREGKTFQIGSAMQTGRAHGMIMLNDALFDLVRKDIVEPRDAYLKAVDKTGFEAMLTKGGYKF